MTETDLGNLTLEQRRALLASLLGREAAASRRLVGPLRPIVSVPRETTLPLSFAQERMWFLDQLTPGSPLYNIPLALRLEGPLDVDLFARAAHTVADRHETLRTTFANDGGIPRAVIGAHAHVPLAIVDLTGVEAVERDGEVLSHLIAEAGRPFDLSTGPLLRLLLLRLAPDEQIIHLTMHHIVSDAWSMAIFGREVATCYGALALGEPVRLPELPVQYVDYAEWQRATLPEAVQDEQISYWRGRLAGAPPLNLPTDRPRPVVPSPIGGRERWPLPPELVTALREFCRAEGTTLFTALLTAFVVLLGRYCRQDDILVGTPVSNRHRTEVEGLVGLFVNTLVVRTSLIGDPSYRELARRVGAAVKEAMDHQDLPFEKVIEGLAPERQLDRSSLFQAMFVMPQAPAWVTDFGGHPATVFDVHSGTAKFDVAASAVDHGSRIDLYLEYRTDLLDAATARRMLNSLDTALAAMLADSALPISRVPLFRSDERLRMLADWNDTVSDSRSDAVNEMFAAQAYRSPDAIACSDGDDTLTYAQLDDQANELARRLIAMGIRAEDVVALILPRGINLLVSALATWRAGGVYCPIEPNHPPARAHRMLAAARLILTDGPMAEQFGSLDIPTLDVSSRHDAAERQSTIFPPVRLDQAACLFYTSGSTGQPKGVVVEHGSLARHLRWISEALLCEHTNVVAAVAEPSFDASLKQLFAPLLAGREVWLLPNDTVADPFALVARFAGRPNIRLAVSCVPALWQVILDALDAGALAPPALTQVILGGDHVNTSLAERTWRHFPGLELWNIYGPTEGTGNAAGTRLFPGDEVTIGRAIANTHVYLLDNHLEPVPVGVPGRLYIGGHNLARGYFNRQAETAASFVADPFRSGRRLYDSGDIGSFLPDGRIRLFGREDSQLKIRGYRVELGEVESAIAAHPAVREVFARSDVRTGGRQLLAYVALRDEVPNLGAAMRMFLADRLPSWMVPSSFLELERLPRLPSGKVDVGALPAPLIARPTSVKPTPPRTDIEQQIATIWRDVIGIDEVGIHDNLFDLGAHSLLIMQIQARLQSQLGRNIPVVDFFRYPDVASLAAHLDKAGLDSSADDAQMARMSRARHALSELRAKSGKTS